ncbi:expansin-A4-like [Argentina anserina]|uniref:expansin-A4-like n=1 Tax=Argentina anserina TaxID=57926 RepID=UPI00217654C1|nr:expansin-A4-like [Potentilla anserina]
MANSMFSVAFRILVALVVIDHNIAGAVAAGWDFGHATFYGDSAGRGTEGGACGYGDPFVQGYGVATAALSTALYNKGQTCGACFEIYCANNPQWCQPGTIKVTVTNECPGGPCASPQKHFDLTMPMFLKIAKAPQAGIIPIGFRRTWCTKRGGIRFAFEGNPNFLLILVSNVGGAGDVVDVKIKGSRQPTWWTMKRNWGQKWETDGNLVGQSLSFQVTTSDGKSLQTSVAPANWAFGQTYVGTNF